MRHLLLSLVLAIVGCGSSSSTKPAAEPKPACRDGVGDDVEVGVRTGVEGAKTGVTTAFEGVKTAGSATVGLVEGGRDEAKERWQEGSDQTKETARKGAAQTKAQSKVPRCPR